MVKQGLEFTQKNIKKSSRLHDFYSIYTAELSAIQHALNYIKKKNINKSIICTDSKSAVLAIANTSKATHHILYIIKKNLINLHKQGKVIKILWIPGHAGITGNLEADKLAKHSLTLPERNHIKCPAEDAGNQVISSLRNLLQFDWDANPHPHFHPIHPKIQSFTSSNQHTRFRETTLARLRLGHVIATHSYLYTQEPPPCCYHCNNYTPLTITHMIITCPHFNQYRNRIKQYLQLHKLSYDLPTLLGDDHPDLIDLLFQYIHDASLLDRI